MKTNRIKVRLDLFLDIPKKALMEYNSKYMDENVEQEVKLFYLLYFKIMVYLLQKIKLRYLILLS